MDPINALIDLTMVRIQEQRVLPEGTYRLQFHAGFKFQDADRLVSYFRDLGISHCYASPYLKARPGSQHGYDIVNHDVLNPEIGSEEEYEAWIRHLHEQGLRQILDIVPNHMGIIGNENIWWNDILENGPSSPYATYFDIAWQSSNRADLRDRVLLPVLGDRYGKVLESGQLRLAFDAGTFTLNYFDHRFPVAPGTYERILTYRLEELEQTLGAGSPAFTECQSILTSIRHLPSRSETDPEKVAERQREKEVIKRRLATLVDSAADVRRFIEGNVAAFNGRPGAPHSFDLLDQLLGEQSYRLADWRVAADEIDYRRFFDVNELAALSMERPEVFAATHGLILRFLRKGKVNGLRIDHPDGLYDPKQYLERLQAHYVAACAQTVAAARPEFRELDWKAIEEPLLERIAERTRAPEGAALRRPLYVVVEKILGRDEPLSPDWPVDGTSGYEFLNMTNGLFVDAENTRALTRIYDDWLGEAVAFSEVVYAKKFLILQVSLSSELHMLAYPLDRLAQQNRRSRDFTLNSLRHALREIIASFPVYRSYMSAEGIHPDDRRYVITAVQRAKRRNPAISASLFDFVRDMLLLEYPETATEEDRQEQRRFVGKFQQVTSPVMAKGVEDTAFYVYNRLLSLNEVGGDPGRFGVAPVNLHRFYQDRQSKWPGALSATATHDTKRGEDVRARLNVLSELPEEWRTALPRWHELNRPHFVELDETTVPGPNEEYFFYQTLLGAWPLEPYTVEDYRQFVVRLQAYMDKAIHEAKVHTSWINPDAAYDDAIRRFVTRVLDETNNGAFLDDFRILQRRISHYGLYNSLAQTLLKIAAPGVPDFYQGTEIWDFSLVDPDNRRPVDYDRRQSLLRELHEQWTAASANRPGLTRQMTQSKEDGRIKLHLITRGMQARRSHPALFSTGEYLPGESSGQHRERLFGFLRRQGENQAVAAIPRLVAGLASDPGDLPLGSSVWQDTALVVSGIAGGQRWRNLFTDEVIASQSEGDNALFPAADLFVNFPVALLIRENH